MVPPQQQAPIQGPTVSCFFGVQMLYDEVSELPSDWHGRRCLRWGPAGGANNHNYYVHEFVIERFSDWWMAKMRDAAYSNPIQITGCERETLELLLSLMYGVTSVTDGEVLGRVFQLIQLAVSLNMDTVHQYLQYIMLHATVNSTNINLLLLMGRSAINAGVHSVDSERILKRLKQLITPNGTQTHKDAMTQLVLDNVPLLSPEVIADLYQQYVLTSNEGAMSMDELALQANTFGRLRLNDLGLQRWSRAATV